ncbi:MAG: DUF4272 domain-containing protein [Planctomycetaceae bacterium]
MEFNSDDIEVKLNPPDASHVAARSLILATVSCRGFIEPDAEDAANFWRRVLDWFWSLGIDANLEPFERVLLDQPLGTLGSQEQVDAAWLCEGVVVLGWAQGRIEMPMYDEQIVAAEVADALGFLKPKLETVLTKPILRSAAEIETCREQIFAIHWRLNEYRIQAKPIDFRTLAKNAWFGPMNLDGCRLIDGDLAIGEARIDSATEAEFRRCCSVVRERHRAANWLCGESEIYSEVPTDT